MTEFSAEILTCIYKELCKLFYVYYVMVITKKPSAFQRRVGRNWKEKDSRRLTKVKFIASHPAEKWMHLNPFSGGRDVFYQKNTSLARPGRKTSYYVNNSRSSVQRKIPFPGDLIQNNFPDENILK